MHTPRIKRREQAKRRIKKKESKIGEQRRDGDKTQIGLNKYGEI
jgi:hypothetical protein